MSNNKPVNRHAATSAFLILTENCNLRCKYCFEGGTRCVNNYMSKEVAFQTIDFLISQAVEYDVDEIKITFFGGEPMLCPELMTEIMHYAEKKAKENNKKTYYNIITNGTIYNEKVEAFLDVWRSYKGEVDIQLSVDGIPEIQNANRPCHAEGMLSSQLVETAIPKFKEYFKKYNINREHLHIHACVSKESLPKIYDSFLYFTKDLDVINSKFAWVIEDNWDDNDLIIFSEQMQKIVKRLVDTTTNLNRFPFKHFNESSGCSAGQNLISVDTQGNIYPCHRYYFLEPNRREDIIIGNIKDGITYNDRREQYIGIDYSKISSDPCQVCVATNYSYTGNILKCPNEYSSKFMNITNQYYQYFQELVDKKVQLDILRKSVLMVEKLTNQVQTQEEKITTMEERIKALEAGI